jgi:hypothetical protein
MNEKPWSELTPRERDALVAEQVFEHKLDYEFAETMGAPTVPALRDGHDEWGILPSYTTDDNDCRLVRKGMHRRDRAYFYLLELYRIACESPDMAQIRKLHFWECWYMMDATPDQHCLAALRALGVKV